MKNVLIILPLLLFGLGTLKAQDSTLVEGMVANLNGKSLTVNIKVSPTALSPVTAKATCDAKGYFSKMVHHKLNSTGTGDVEVSFTDCNSKTVTEKVSYTPNNGGWVGFFKLDYCSNPSITCEARFTITQAKTGNGHSVPGQLIVYESSVGAALSSFHWDFGDGATSNLRTPSHSYKGNGPYEICLIVGDSNGCRDTLCDTIRVDTTGLLVRKKAGFSMTVIHGDAPTSIAPVTSNGLNASVYPNPVKNTVNIKYTVTEATFVHMAIYNISGVLVQETGLTANSGENNLQLNLENLKPGAYTIRMSTTQGQWIEPILKN